jgi:hypothetical protein
MIWSKAKTINDLIYCNIESIKGEMFSPYQFIEQSKSPLTPDTIINLETIIEINKKMFMTIGSQPSLKDEFYTTKPIDDNYAGFVEEHYNPELDDQKDGKYKCIEYQRGYCDGFIHKFVFDKFKKNISNNYELYYYNPFTGEIRDDFVNLTYLEFNDIINYCTNFSEIKDSYENEIYFFSRYISNDTLNKMKEELIYVFITDLDYNTGKNIYQDILKALE